MSVSAEKNIHIVYTHANGPLCSQASHRSCISVIWCWTGGVSWVPLEFFFAENGFLQLPVTTLLIAGRPDNNDEVASQESKTMSQKMLNRSGELGANSRYGCSPLQFWQTNHRRLT